MINKTELLQRQVCEWQTEVHRLQGLIAVATENYAPLASPQQQLVDVGTGKIAHIYGGECPDELEGRDTRDPECPACQVLTRAAMAAPNQASAALLDGWKLVPIDPTDAMQMVGAESIRLDTTAINRIWTGNKVYRAMIAAAPVPPPPVPPVLSDMEIINRLSNKLAHHSGSGEHAYIKCHHWYATADDLVISGRDLLARVRS
ncbi:hypothetical protein [Collimonas pratensis]|uniref:hypothetical protein n=1 Tax=Collimonas pratensis TaxID=279113 RepID=UPI000784CC69|nr:hypothetical protein [Collimonas pratensis]